MPIQKQTAPINFSQGLDTKTDPLQVVVGRFLALSNSVFTTGGRLTKRNGYGSLAALPFVSSFLTTLNGDLTAVGGNIQAYSSESQKWTPVSNFYPCNLSTLALVRNTTNQSQVDTAIAPNGLICAAYTDQNPASLAVNQYKYVVYDSVTGQQLLAPTIITNAHATLGYPRVFSLGQYFIVAYVADVSGTQHLQFIAVNINNFTSTIPADISASITSSSGIAWDAAVLNNKLYFAWNSAGGVGLKMGTLSATLLVSANSVVDPAHTSTQVSVCVDSMGNTIWVTYYSSATTNAWTVAVNTSLAPLAGFPVQSVTATQVVNTTSCVATSGTLSVFIERPNAYSYDAAIPTNFINKLTVNQTTAAVSIQTTLERSVGIASKAFVVESVPYLLSAYSSPFQPTYFLLNGLNGNVITKLAYSNGGGYLTHGLPSVFVSGQAASVAYLFKDLIEPLANANSAGTSVVGGVYSQTGINQASFVIGTDAVLTAAEIGQNLNITGGFLWGYDGTQTTEQGFFVWPDSVERTGTATTGGNLKNQKYFYAVIYSWTDNRGNAFRSASSIPIASDLTGSVTITNTATIQGPNLRLTYKTNVKIEIYRWSTDNQTFYQVTSITAPVLNSTTTDSWTFTDTLADASIVGNSILYTTGGVIEDIGPPSFKSTFLFDDRLWGIDSEDPNLLWFSKQVIESTPVEMSDLLTVFIAPSIGAEGTTGELTCGQQMDDKLILFKPTAMSYINGNGPDNTGSNNGYSQPIFITSMVGCSNQASIVVQPNGLMFEFKSPVGNQIWMLGRDLNTQYVGAAVEGLTMNASVNSAVAIPGTTAVKFTLSSGITLMYDYYYNQWGTDTTTAVSSTIFQGLHTYINSNGAVFQETPGLYVDGSIPVLMSFTTSWLNLTGLQGYQRAYWFYLLGQYVSPHKIQLGVAYDYSPFPHQQIVITPNNFSGFYGQASPYGSDSPYGGPGTLEQWKIFLTQQRCQAFQIQFQEQYDPRMGVSPGAGLTISGLNLVFGQKKGYVPLPFAQGVS